MSVSGYAESLLGGLDTEVKRSLIALFRYVLPNGRFGSVANQRKSENFQAYFLQSTTTSSSNTEFSITHGMGRSPYLILPVLPLDSSGANLVPLYVTRPADAMRIYLRSTSTSAAFSVYVE